MILVEPDCDPDMVRLPFDVVTVQSPVCALGLDSTECMTSMLAVIFELVMVIGRAYWEDVPM